MPQTARQVHAWDTDMGPSAEARSGFAACIDEAASLDAPARAFLRRAWFAAAQASGAATLVGRRGDGSAFVAIPTLPFGPAIAAARSVPGSYWPFRGFPLAADASEAELADFLGSTAARAALGQVWRLGPAYRTDPAVALTVKAARKAGWTVLKRSLGTTFLLDLAAARAEGNWPRKSTRRKLRTYEGRLAERGEVAFRFVRGADWTPEILADLAGIEARSWVGRSTDGSGAKFLKEEQRGYWAGALRDPILADMLSAVLLEINGQPVAFSFDLDADGTQYGIASSYDEQYADYRPGTLVTYRQLEAAAARGIRLVDWGAGDGGYKREAGAVPGAEIVDCLFVRNRALAGLLRGKWRRPSADGPRAAPADSLGRVEQALLATLGMAAAAVAFIE